MFQLLALGAGLGDGRPGAESDCPALSSCLGCLPLDSRRQQAGQCSGLSQRPSSQLSSPTASKYLISSSQPVFSKRGTSCLPGMWVGRPREGLFPARLRPRNMPARGRWASGRG